MGPATAVRLADAGWGGHMAGWGWGGIVMMVLWWLVIAAAVVALVRFARPDETSTGATRSGREILEERYARGEIDAAEFGERSRVLREGS